MIQLSALVSQLINHLRIQLRLTRSWIAILISMVMLIMMYYYGLINSINYSYRSITYLAFNPGFNQGFFDQLTLLVAAGITILLSFDWNHRLKSNLICEVVYSAPVSNLSMIISQFLCSFLIAYLMIVIVAILERVMSHLIVLPFYDLTSILDGQLFRFLLIDSVVYLVLVTSMTLLCSVIFSNRLFAIVIPLVSVILYFFLLFEVPLNFQSIVAPVGEIGLLRSNFDPSFVLEFEHKVFKFLCLSTSGLFLIFASIRLDRIDRFNRFAFNSVSGLFLISVLTSFGYLIFSYSGTSFIDDKNLMIEDREGIDSEGFIETIFSEFELRADGSIFVDSEYRIRTCDQFLRFHVNPGLKVKSAMIDNIDTTWVQNRDFVSITTPEGSGNCSHSYRVVASGEIQIDYALSSDMRRITKSSLRESDGHLFGYRWSTINSEFIGLMPQSAWLPLPLFSGREERSFALDLKVVVPAGLVPVSVGHRSLVSNRLDKDIYRFISTGNRNVVPLIAARFAVSSVRFPHVNIHFLYNVKHKRNYENLAKLLKENDLLRYQLGLFPDGLFSSIDEREQPFEFYFVEVPSYLRTHQLDPEYRSFESFPGLYLHKEFGFGSVTFLKLGNSSEDDHVGLASELLSEQYVEYFGSYFFGEDLLHAVSLTVVDDLLRSSGYENQHLRKLLVGLGKRSLSRLSRYGSTQSYSPYVLEYPNLYAKSSLLSLFKRYVGMDRSYLSSTYVHSRDESVWDALEFNRTRDVLLDDSLSSASLFAAIDLRTRTTVDLIFDHFGGGQLFEILAHLSKTDKLGPLDTDRLIKNAYEYDEDLGDILHSWASEMDLPGFLVSELQLRLKQQSEGFDHAYSYEFTVRNDERESGWVRFNYVLDMPTFSLSKYGVEGPTKVDGNSETPFLISTEYPLQTLYVDYYLSKNRSRYKGIVLPTSSTAVRGDDKPVYAYDLYSSSLLVDDLDENFLVASAGSIDCEGRNTVFESQDLLPDTRGCWSRRTDSSAWGKYRSTYVRTLAANGQAYAYFDFDMSVCSKWELSYFLPAKRFPVLSTFDLTMVFPSSSEYFELGTVDMEIEYADRVLPMSFDAAKLSVGWNLVGELEITTTEGNLRVSISDRTNGDIVVVDAVKLDCVLP